MVAKWSKSAILALYYLHLVRNILSELGRVKLNNAILCGVVGAITRIRLVFNDSYFALANNVSE